MDPVRFGVSLMMNLGLGLCTPPVGACLFVGCAIGDVPIDKAVRTIWPFYLEILVALAIVTFVPVASLLLPDLLEPAARYPAVPRPAIVSSFQLPERYLQDATSYYK